MSNILSKAKSLPKSGAEVACAETLPENIGLG